MTSDSKTWRRDRGFRKRHWIVCFFINAIEISVFISYLWKHAPAVEKKSLFVLYNFSDSGRKRDFRPELSELEDKLWAHCVSERELFTRRVLSVELRVLNAVTQGLTLRCVFLYTWLVSSDSHIKGLVNPAFRASQSAGKSVNPHQVKLNLDIIICTIDK